MGQESQYLLIASSITCLNDLSFLIVSEVRMSTEREKILDNFLMTSCTGDQKRGEAIVVLWIKTSPFGDQKRKDDAVTMPTSDDERGDRSVSRIYIDPFGEEGLDDGKVSHSTSHHQDIPAFLILVH